MSKGVSRATPNSKRGRQMYNIGRTPESRLEGALWVKDTNRALAIAAWNARVEQEKAAKKAASAAKRATTSR